MDIIKRPLEHTLSSRITQIISYRRKSTGQISNKNERIANESDESKINRVIQISLLIFLKIHAGRKSRDSNSGKDKGEQDVQLVWQ